MGIRDKKGSPLGAGRVRAGLFALMKRSGGGGIAIAIGALGAAALLATTLVFPPPPVQRVFQTPTGRNGNDTAFDRPDGGKDAIQVPTEESSESPPPPADEGSTPDLLAALDDVEGEETPDRSDTGGVRVDERGVTPGGDGENDPRTIGKHDREDDRVGKHGDKKVGKHGDKFGKQAGRKHGDKFGKQAGRKHGDKFGKQAGRKHGDKFGKQAGRKHGDPHDHDDRDHDKRRKKGSKRRAKHGNKGKRD